MIFQVQHYFYDSCIEKRFSYFSPGSECRFLSRVEGRMSRVVGKLSRVEGRMSRVVGKLSRVEGKMSRVEGTFFYSVF